MERSTDKHTSYGAWVAYMMDVKRVDTAKLAERSGYDERQLDQLISGELPKEEAREAVMQLGEILLTEDVRKRMENVVRALDIHVDLRNWRSSCDGGCCAWNIVTEIAGDPALRAIETQ
jgi:hypothetical protein